MKGTERNLSRRSFIRDAGAGALGIAGMGMLAGCSPKSTKAIADNAANNASENPTWLGSEPEIDESKIVEAVDCDVCVCGGGTAGLFAACAAAENGAKVVLLEQFSKNSGHGVRDDLGVINSQAQQDAGATIDVPLLAQYLQMHTSWYQNEQLFKLWASESGETMDWYSKRIKEGGYGMKVQLVSPPAGQVPSFSTAVDVDWGDVAALTAGSTANNGQYILNPYAESIGVNCLWETSLVKCTKEDGRVTGVIGKSAAGYTRIRASKGVILCCGGYLNNDDMMDALQPNVKKVTVYNSTWPQTNGDGIKAGIWAGGALDPIHAVSSWEQGLIPPDKTTEDAHDSRETHWIGPLPFLRVNLEGQRFMNESCSFDSLGHALLYQPGHTAVQIWDNSWMEDAQQFNVYGAHRYFPYDNGIKPLFSIDTVLEAMQKQIASGLIVKADTVEELAKKIGVPADNLSATIKRYNQLAAAGEDSDFGKPAYRMTAIDQAPYYAARFAEQGSHTMDGLVVDADLHVLNENRDIIPGLYAAGDNAGSHLGVTYMGNAAGNAAGRSITYGRHAGRIAALS